jgi:membrane protein YdbS with pleckstrin-like domain
VTPSVETTDPDGVDFGWVMQVTFVTTILVGAPLVAVLSLGVTLPDWSSRALFAVRVGAVVWLFTAVGTYSYARWYREPDSDGGTEEPGDAGDGPTDPAADE